MEGVSNQPSAAVAPLPVELDSIADDTLCHYGHAGRGFAVPSFQI